MTPTETAAILRQFNDWRRGGRRGCRRGRHVGRPRGFERVGDRQKVARANPGARFESALVDSAIDRGGRQDDILKAPVCPHGLEVT